MKSSLNIEYKKPDLVRDKEVGNTSAIYEQKTDRELWSMLQKGDQGALGYIYNKHIHQLFRFGYQINKDQDLIRDCIQEVFTTIGRKKGAMQSVQSIKSYLYKCVYREVIYRLKQRRRLLSTADLDADAFGIDICVESRMINHQHFADKVDQVKDAMNKLSPKQRQVILHYFYDGFTYDEIADIMGLQHKNTVARMFKRALDVLKQNVLVVFITSFFGLQSGIASLDK